MGVTMMKAAKVAPPEEFLRTGRAPGLPAAVGAAAKPAARAVVRRGHVAHRDPRGREVRWWERPVPPEARDPEAAIAVRELCRLLHATGRYRVSDLARACAGLGRPHARETISRVLNGTQPPSMQLVEDLARAANIDLAFVL